MQSALQLLFPPQCISCGDPTVSDFGLCGVCWRQTPFITGLVCDRCGTPLPGEEEGRAEYCDDCLTVARPWERGRSALLYRDNARKLVLALKHGDRLDLARPAGGWLHRAARPLFRAGMLIVPLPPDVQAFQTPFNVLVSTTWGSTEINVPMRSTFNRQSSRYWAAAYSSVRAPMIFSATPIVYDHPSPRLGEHTAEILAELEKKT